MKRKFLSNEDEYSIVYTEKTGLVVEKEKFLIHLAEEKTLLCKITDIEYIKDVHTLHIDLENGKTIEIYWNIPDKKIIVESD